MPKIFFYDTGLLCYLLSIESSEQLDNHPLKGAIFENLAMNELLKDRFNKGLDPNLYYYREKSGIEVDALLIEDGILRLYEMKAGKTFRPEFMENMKQISKTLENATSTTVIYDGESIPPIILNVRDI